MSFDERPQNDQPQYGQSQYVRPQPTQYPLQPGYVYPQPAYGLLRDNSNATLAMVLGILGLATMLAVLSPFAWWKGSQALAEIDSAPGVYGNRGMAVAGRITGIIGTVLLGLAVLLGLLALISVVFFAAS